MKTRDELNEIKQKILTELQNSNDEKTIQKLNELYINVIFKLYQIEKLK
jgi:hypothetical protein